MRATDGILHLFTLRASSKGSLAPAIIIASILFVAALGLFVFVRRATGALTTPLAAPQLVATAAVMFLWALVVREFTARRMAYFWVSLATMVLVAIGCSFPAARFVDWLVWLPAIACISALPYAARAQVPKSNRFRSSDSTTELADEQVLQNLTRFRTADGKEAIRGALTAEFAAGERQTTLYVAFCPPFELLPQVEANLNDDLEAEIKLAQVLHNGAQFDIRLSEPAEEPISVSIEFFASEGL